MYVHLGGDLVLPVGEIVGILDARLVRVSEDTRRFYERAVAEGRVRGSSVEKEHTSLVVTPTHIYVSPISSATLARRIAAMSGLLASRGAAPGAPGSPEE